MFGLFKKKETKPLYIHAKDVFSIIKLDYEDGIAFCLIEFKLDGHIYTMGSSLHEEGEETKENIDFVFEDQTFDSYNQFETGARVNGHSLFETNPIIEVLRAGIIDGEAMIKTPWGDTRLAKMALQD